MFFKKNGERLKLSVIRRSHKRRSFPTYWITQSGTKQAQKVIEFIQVTDRLKKAVGNKLGKLECDGGGGMCVR